MIDIEKKHAAYQAALSAANIELKGKNNLYTSHHGHMFSFLGSGEVLAVRLSPENKLAYEKMYNTEDVVQHGRVMREYVPVVESVIEDVSKLVELLKQSLLYVDSLPVKPTKKKSKKN